MSLFRHKRIYLDWASSAPVSKNAWRALDAAVRAYGNPSSPHGEGARAKRLLEEARTTVARIMEVKASGVVFTSGATEANNLGLLGHSQWLRSKGVAATDIHILYLPSAHASIIKGIEALAEQGIETEALSVREGRIDLEKLRAQLKPITRLVLMDAVCGETGTVWDTRAVRNALDAYAKEHATPRVLLHVDASQAPLALPASLTRFNADVMALDAQKIGGVRGVGALCMRSHVKVSPLLYGGGQESGMRAGTEPVAVATAFAAALTDVEMARSKFVTRAQVMRERLIAELKTAITDVVVNAGAENVPNILNLSFPGRDTDYLVMLLDREGFAVATKSACETDSAEGSRAVMALTGNDELSRSTLRISWGPSTRGRDLSRLARALIRAIRFLDGASVY